MNTEVNNIAPDVAFTWFLYLILQNQAKVTAETT